MNSDFTPIQTLTLNHRTTSFRRVGTGRRKILFFHGFPGSSIQIEPFRALTEAFDLEVICLDRPGYHQSEWQEGGQFQQATSAARDILKHFAWDSFEVVSVSGGTPFLFHFVQSFSNDIHRVSIVCGLGPMMGEGFTDLLSSKKRMALKLLPYIPGFLFSKILPQGNARGAQKANVISYFLPTSKADNEVVKDSFVQNVLGQAVREAFQQKGRGPQRDAVAYLSPWNVDLGNYKGPIHIWHGSDDQILPLEMAQQISKKIPNSSLHIAEGEGHYSLAFKMMENILR